MTQPQPTPEQATEELRTAVAVLTAVTQFRAGQVGEQELLSTVDGLANAIGGVELLVMPLAYVGLRLASMLAQECGCPLEAVLADLGIEAAGPPPAGHDPAGNIW